MSFLINDQNAQTVFGLTFLKGTYKALQKLPKRKPGIEIEWADEHGSERDVEVIYYHSRSLTLPVLIESTAANSFEDNLQLFREFITTVGYFNLKAVEKNRQYTLLYDDVSDYEEFEDHATFNLLLIDDFPHITDAPPPPSNNYLPFVLA